MKKNLKHSVNVTSYFPVSIDYYHDGYVAITDLMGIKWQVKTKNGKSLTEEDFNDIVREALTFWDIAKKYALTIEERPNE